MTENWNAHTTQALEIIPKGAFLTVKHEGKLNTMTIGWGSFGFAWGKPIFTAMVRPSRYTYELIEKSGEFTVTVPLSDMKQSLALCGTKSGRDLDKFAAADLKALEGRVVATPVIDCPALQYECKIVGKQPLLPEQLDPSICSGAYGSGDFHTLYFGEIVAAYVTD